ncbi:hypothetical protein CTAYLR_000439 [Chrysophaeum taylorii]|uniref:MAPEG family protein n=1 Tax=Chrysophaeum taylorii TaxID=2483200 RepID=A0AAD7UI68_9STRA|nr:hypothetical protein CTAYLR_000439 [Chrysophaeum taylorii]
MGEESKEDGPPPPLMVLGIYLGLGAALSFGIGRTPGTFAVADSSWTIFVVCLFFVWYSVYDVMTIGKVRADTKCFDAKKLDDIPEELHLALRAQGNQVEQMPHFVTSTLLFSVFVNAKAAALIAATWVTLRAMYAHTYRASVGTTFRDKRLGRFTIPCYFMLNAMAMATAIHMLRFSLTA